VFGGGAAERQNVRVTDATHSPDATDSTDQLDATPDPTSLDPQIAALLKRDEHGLVAAVVQQHDTRDVLMVGWMDDEALRRTLGEGRVTFWSRSRKEYWRKGDTSGHVQWVKGVRLDCDGDAVLVTVDQQGAACHTGDRTCFDARVLPARVGEPTPG
jgi:phosphoribosyl-AMP cyclohydrolase